MRWLMLAVLLPAGLLAQTGPSNLDFESGAVGAAPPGWLAWSYSGAAPQAVVVDQN
ncbi:MAG: hypothetical protein ABSE56_18605 [Bryobacteraceae bacterium]|jgi:hypothetical protein